MPDTLTPVSDETFMENVREARANGFDRLCVHCGVGVYDDSDMHERGCPEYVPFDPQSHRVLRAEEPHDA